MWGMKCEGAGEGGCEGVGEGGCERVKCEEV